MQAMLENRLLEEELNSVKELSFRVARWLMHGPPVEIPRLCRERAPREEVQHLPSHISRRYHRCASFKQGCSA